MKQTIEISSGTIMRIILFGLLLFFLYLIREVVAIVFLSIVIASAVGPAAKWFEKYYLPRVVGVLIVYLAAFAVLSLTFYLIIPPIFFEISDFLNTTDLNLSEISFKFMPDIYTGTKVQSSVSGVTEKIASASEKFLSQVAQGFFGTVSAVFGGAMSFVLIVIISFYLSVQKGGIEHFLKIVTPSSYEDYILGLWERSQRKIGRWLRGQLLLGLLIGSLVFIGLTLLGIKYAISLALLSAIFELIPIFGPIMAAIPAIIFGFLQAPWLGLAVLILYVVIQQFENHLIYPLVVRKIIGVPPILVILSLIIGGKLAGFFGILLSVPVAVILIEILNDIAARKQKDYSSN